MTIKKCIIKMGEIMNRLKELREYNGLTQEQCAKIAFISKKSYERYEKEERVMPLDTAILFAKYYNVSLDYIAGISEEKETINRAKLSG